MAAVDDGGGVGSFGLMEIDFVSLSKLNACWLEVVEGGG